MVPIFLLAISFLTAMRIWFSLGTFVNLLETKADRNHLFPRARRSPPQTRSSSFDLPWGIFATICSTKALRSNKWAGETPYNHKVRMKQQTSLKPCHISCQGSLFGVSFVCSAWLQTRAKANPFKTMTLKNILNIFGITMIPCLNIEVCWKPLFDTPNEPDHIPDPAVTGCGGMCSTCLWPSEHSSDPGITSSYSRFISSINKTAPHWRPGQTAFNWQAIGGCWYTYLHIYIYTFLHIYIFTYLHIYIYTYIHIYIYTYIHTSTFTYTPTDKYIHIYIHLHLHIHLTNAYFYIVI